MAPQIGCFVWWNIVQKLQISAYPSPEVYTHHKSQSCNCPSTLIHLWAKSYRVCIFKNWKSVWKLHHSIYEPNLMVSIPFYSVSYINTQFYFNIPRYTLWYWIDLTSRAFYLVLRICVTCLMMIDINQNMQRWKEMCCVGRYCVYIRCEHPKITTDELTELLLPF